MIGVVSKETFFDRQAVIDSMDHATWKVLSRFGAYVRNRARRSIRNRKRPSRPGQPPTNQTGLLRQHIYFQYGFAQRSVVIGPMALYHPCVVPPLLEYGGRVWRRDRKGQPFVATYEARPYMRPAFARELARLPALWANSVKSRI